MQAEKNKKNIQRIESIVSCETYESIKGSLIKNFPEFNQKLNNLEFKFGRVINNPKQIVNLFEAAQFKNSDKIDIVNGWICLLDLFNEIIASISINACLIFQYCRFNVKNTNRSVDFVSYLIIKSDQFLELKKQLEPAIIDSLNSKILNLYEKFLHNCNVPLNSLYPATKILSKRFHQNTLKIQSIKLALSLINKIGHQKQKTQKLKPFFYFDGYARVGLRVLLTNNKWIFSKGLHISIWFKAFKGPQQENNIVLLRIKTDDKKQIQIIKQRQEIAVSCISGQQTSYRKVCDLPHDTLVRLQVILSNKQIGIFKSTQYELSIGINGIFCRNIEIKVPKFNSNSFITDFNILQNFFGVLYSVIMTTTEVKMPDQLFSQQQVTDFCHNNQQTPIIAILSPLRVHKGIVINQINSQMNHGCHESEFILNQICNLPQVLSKPQISLVLMYFCSYLFENTKKLNISSEQRKQLCKIFNQVITNFCKNLFCYPLDLYCNNSLTSNKHLSNLFLLYFLQLTQYPINQATLNNIVQYSCIDSYSGNFLIRFQDFYGIIKSKMLNVEKALSIYTIKRQKQLNQKLAKGYNQAIDEAKTIVKGEIQVPNPVTKIQLLFLLQTQWKKYWNRLQYTSEWWEPPFSFQNNYTFDQNSYLFKLKDQNYERSSFQWTVIDFITNDFCDCILVPKINIPEWARSNKFEQMYKKRECMDQQFNQRDIWRCFLNLGEGIKSRKYQFRHTQKSIMSKIKSKISQSARIDSVTQISLIDDKGSPEELKEDSQNYFQTPVCYINLLTLYIGVISIRTIPQKQKKYDQKSHKISKQLSAVISFYPCHTTKDLDHLCVKAYKHEEFPTICLYTQDIKSIRKRRYNQTMNGMQIRLKSGYNYLFYFHQQNSKGIDAFISKLCPKILPISIISKDPYEDYLKSNYTIMWIDKQISNYQYLQYLNDVSGRSYSDITQYPVLPWVFHSNDQQVQLSKEQNYRDLTKNMGSIGPESRRNHFIQKFETKNQTQIFGDYHFGTHYSSSAIIFNFLIRLQPFSTGAVTLQSGKFDCADRVFSSYIGSWINATTSTTDIRQLLPQIYVLPEMMINVNNYDFGLTQQKERICNVQLPKWSKNNPYLFCSVLRKSLQSHYTEQKIKNWIDLVYGYKQKGEAAVNNMNIFFPLTYELAIKIDNIQDKQERVSIQTQIAHFGQNPAQIIGGSPHPDRLTLKHKWQDKLLADGNQVVIQRTTLTRMHILAQQKFIYQSVFEDKNSILNIKFISDNLFLVLRRYQFIIFKILDQQSGFISKQSQIDYTTQKQNISLDYLSIKNFVPLTIISQNLALVGGFYNGNIQMIFLKDAKYSGNLKLPMKTISALAFQQNYNLLYVGDSIGNLGVYQFSNSYYNVCLTEKFYDRIHALKINCISLNYKANMFVTASQDGSIKLFNLYSQQMYRKISNPFGCSVIFASISTCPLYSVVFFSREDSKIYSYSINGQFLAQKEEITGFIYNLKIHKASDQCQYLTTLNANRQIQIEELPFLNPKKKIRLKKDNYKISCFQMTDRIAIAGSQDGGLQIIADPSSF